MVTKLKNSRKTAIVLMLAAVFFCSAAMMNAYGIFRQQLPSIRENVREEVLKERAADFAMESYFLYNQVYGGLTQSDFMWDYDANGVLLLQKYMEYEVFDEDGKAVLGDEKSETAKRLASETTDYAFRAAVVVTGSDELKEVKVDGSELDPKDAYDLEEEIVDQSREYGLFDGASESAEMKDAKIIFAMTEEQLDAYVEENVNTDAWYAMALSNDANYLTWEWMLAILAIFMGAVVARRKVWRIYDWEIFRAPLEVVVIVWLWVIAQERTVAGFVWNYFNHIEQGGLSSGESLLHMGMWFLLFGAACWGGVCLSEVFTLGKGYFAKRSLCVRAYRYFVHGDDGDNVKHGADEVAGLAGRIWKKSKAAVQKTYDDFLHMDFQEQSNKMILRAIAINFILLLIITWMWVYGIFALIIYSVILFLILRKYSRDIQKKYSLLLESTNLLAEGNLDAPIEGDLGLFNPMKTELKKIQQGFKKAVQEEVKSERMKTELITNVSHDLKTPLTAIITYVDLLKSEEDPEKRKEYLEVLERKSLRLKVLIEDLFEISKATSKNVTMNFMQVDIVGLLKQVGLECDSKIQAANLDLRWNLPEGKVVMLLDSQKTYRIFENLIVNITKYAMPHTRVYVDLTDEEKQVMISMKNVSAEELNFNSEEITDRFVRGDASRNTEGSGLGLAIAKSFTELQFGTLTVSTDADLFKVTIRLPKRTEGEP